MLPPGKRGGGEVANGLGHSSVAHWRALSAGTSPEEAQRGGSSPHFHPVGLASPSWALEPPALAHGTPQRAPWLGGTSLPLTGGGAVAWLGQGTTSFWSLRDGSRERQP